MIYIFHIHQNQKNSILLKIIKLFKNIISSNSLSQSITEQKVEFSDIKKIILNQNNLSASPLQSKSLVNCLKQYFGDET
jgi:hypothetical protein